METNGINVLSLFDGMSCGMIALERAGIPVKNYYASEIDKYAITVSKANYPQIQQIGSVTELNYIDGYLCSPTQQIYVGEIDLLIGGSPCQNFSFAGSRKGMVTKDNAEVLSLDQYLELKRDGFEFKGESFLFWEYVRLLKEVKPKHFLLENVKMAKKWSDLITSIVKVKPILINSALVSAQQRKRLYWTSIENITQPQDKGIVLKDVIDYSVPFKNYFDYSKTKFAPSMTNGVITINPRKTDGSQSYQQDRIYHTAGKMTCLSAELSGRFNVSKPINLGNINPSGRGQNGNVYSVEGLSPCLTTNKGEGFKCAHNVYRVNDNERVLGITENERGYRPHKGDIAKSGISELGRILKPDSKTDTVLTSHMPKIAVNDNIKDLLWRKATPLECERLQTVPDGYSSIVSDSQRYKMLGNGWTVDVIAHIFKNLKHGTNR